MIQPKISVVTVCYNAVRDIEKTILSVVNQTYPNIEYIIIDGGSKDGTMDVVNRYKDKIDVIVSEPDKGIYDAMNKGTKKASGDFLQFLNAGDVLCDSMVLDKIFSSGIEDTVDVVYGDIIYVMKHGTFYKVPEPIDKFTETFPIAHPASFVNKKVFDSLKFDTRLKIAADFALLKQIYDKGGNFLYKEGIPVAIFDSISGVSSKNVYQAWLEFNVVQGNNKGSCWTLKCFIKRTGIKFKNHLSKIFSMLSPERYKTLCLNRQLRNKTFKLIS